MPKVNPPKPRIVFPSTPINAQPPSLIPIPPNRLKSKRAFWISISLIVVVILIFVAIRSGVFVGTSAAPTLSQLDQDATATAQAANVAATNVALQNTGPQPIATLPTDTSTPAAQPTLTPIPSANDLNQLISSRDGSVTNVSTPTLDADGKQGVAIDVQVNSPTQPRVKHLCFELAQFFFQRSDIGLINIAFHANGYTGLDDPIAQCAGLAPTGWLGMDENQLWNALGVFDANLPA